PPHEHFDARPHSRVAHAPYWHPGADRSWCPLVEERVEATAVVELRGNVRLSTPNEHLPACPHRRVMHTRGGNAGAQRRRPPGVSRWYVASTRLQELIDGARRMTSPDDHLGARPDRGVAVSRARSVSGGNRGHPAVRRRAVPSAGVVSDV